MCVSGWASRHCGESSVFIGWEILEEMESLCCNNDDLLFGDHTIEEVRGEVAQVGFERVSWAHLFIVLC